MEKDSTFTFHGNPLFHVASYDGIFVVPKSWLFFARNQPYEITCRDFKSGESITVVVHLDGKLSPYCKSNALDRLIHLLYSATITLCVLFTFPPPFSFLLLSLSPLLFFYTLEILPPIISGDLIVDESSTLILDCNIFNSYPIPSVAWFGPQGGSPLVRKRMLIIPNITRSMAGQYRCSASYNGNIKNSYVNVTVQCKCREQDGGREGTRKQQK